MKPLFIPLKRIYFEAFARREKRLEVRRYGPRWNERTCPKGRKVILSCGYSGSRMFGTIRNFYRVSARDVSQAARDIYPDCDDFAMIGIDVSPTA